MKVRGMKQLGIQEGEKGLRGKKVFRKGEHKMQRMKGPDHTWPWRPGQY